MQNEIIGPGRLNYIDNILDEHHPKKVFIVSGKKSYQLSGAQAVLESRLKEIDFFRYSEFEENPKFEDLLQGTKVLKNYKPDLIIAVGGGSVLDTAKIISVLPEDRDHAKKTIQGDIPVQGKFAPMIAIPTTSGSGSEATHFAVAYVNKEKYSVAAELLMPDYVIIDPELTYSMPPYQTAVSGMDALCQSIESYWAKGATSESRKYSKKALQLILPNLEHAVKNGDSESRYNMLIGSNYAGKAINISKTTAPHALSYSLTTEFGIPHGHAVAMILGHFFEFNMSQIDANDDGAMHKTMRKLFSLLESKQAKECSENFYELMEKVGLEKNLSQLDVAVNSRNVKNLADSVNLERLSNHPVSVPRNDLVQILNKIL